MYRFLLGLLLAIILTASCVTLDSANVVGPSDGGGAAQLGINRVEITPSQFETTNGATMVAEIRAYAGGVPVAAGWDYSAAIEPNGDVVTILNRGADSVTMKAENPGNTDLVIVATASGTRATARITVKPASE